MKASCEFDNACVRNGLALGLAGVRTPDSHGIPGRDDKPFAVGTEGCINRLPINLKRRARGLSRFAIPEIDLVASCGDDLSAIGREECRFEAAIVNHGCASRLTALRIPDAGGKVITPYQNRGPVRTKYGGKRSDRLRHWLAQWSSRLRIPYSDRVVVGNGYDFTPVGTERGCQNRCIQAGGMTDRQRPVALKK